MIRQMLSIPLLITLSLSYVLFFSQGIGEMQFELFSCIICKILKTILGFMWKNLNVSPCLYIFYILYALMYDSCLFWPVTCETISGEDGRSRAEQLLHILRQIDQYVSSSVDFQRRRGCLAVYEMLVKFRMLCVSGYCALGCRGSCTHSKQIDRTLHGNFSNLPCKFTFHGSFQNFHASC